MAKIRRGSGRLPGRRRNLRSEFLHGSLHNARSPERRCCSRLPFESGEQDAVDPARRQYDLRLHPDRIFVDTGPRYRQWNARGAAGERIQADAVARRPPIYAGYERASITQPRFENRRDPDALPGADGTFKTAGRKGWPPFFESDIGGG